MKSFVQIFLIVLLFGCGSDDRKNVDINVGGDGESASIEIGESGIKIVANDGADKAEINIGKNGVNIIAKDKDGNADIRINEEGVLIESDDSKLKVDSDGYIFEGSNLNHDVNVDNKNVVIVGASNKINLTGKVKSLKINGAANVVHVNKVKDIQISGMRNKVYWKKEYRGKSPLVDKSGMGNLVEQKDFNK